MKRLIILLATVAFLAPAAESRVAADLLAAVLPASGASADSSVHARVMGDLIDMTVKRDGKVIVRRFVLGGLDQPATGIWSRDIAPTGEAGTWRQWTATDAAGATAEPPAEAPVQGSTRTLWKIQNGVLDAIRIVDHAGRDLVMATFSATGTVSRLTKTEGTRSLTLEIDPGSGYPIALTETDGVSTERTDIVDGLIIADLVQGDGTFYKGTGTLHCNYRRYPSCKIRFSFTVDIKEPRVVITGGAIHHGEIVTDYIEHFKGEEALAPILKDYHDLEVGMLAKHLLRLAQARLHADGK